MPKKKRINVNIHDGITEKAALYYAFQAIDSLGNDVKHGVATFYNDVAVSARRTQKGNLSLNVYEQEDD